MGGQKQAMLGIIQRHKSSSEQWPTFQIEAFAGIASGYIKSGPLPLIYGQGSEIDHRELEYGGVVNDLDRFSGNHRKSGPPNLVSPDYLCQASRQRLNVARATAMKSDGFVVQRRELARSLVEPPNLLLCERERHRTRSRLALQFRPIRQRRDKIAPPLYLEQSLLGLREAGFLGHA